MVVGPAKVVDIKSQGLRLDVLPNGEIRVMNPPQSCGWVSLNGVTFTAKHLEEEHHEEARRTETREHLHQHEIRRLPLGLEARDRSDMLAAHTEAWPKGHLTGPAEYEGRFSACCASKQNGSVHLQGVLGRDSTDNRSPDLLLCTLPEGFRPDKRCIFCVMGSSGGARVDVLPSGEVRLRSLDKWVSLCNITFPIKVVPRPRASRTRSTSKPKQSDSASRIPASPGPFTPSPGPAAGPSWSPLNSPTSIDFSAMSIEQDPSPNATPHSRQSSAGSTGKRTRRKPTGPPRPLKMELGPQITGEPECSELLVAIDEHVAFLVGTVSKQEQGVCLPWAQGDVIGQVAKQHRPLRRFILGGMLLSGVNVGDFPTSPVRLSLEHDGRLIIAEAQGAPAGWITVCGLTYRIDGAGFDSQKLELDHRVESFGGPVYTALREGDNNTSACRVVANRPLAPCRVLKQGPVVHLSGTCVNRDSFWEEGQVICFLPEGLRPHGRLCFRVITRCATLDVQNGTAFAEAVGLQSVTFIRAADSEASSTVNRGFGLQRRVFSSSLTDPNVSDVGRWQAQRLRATSGSRSNDVVVSSPHKSALETTAILFQDVGARIITSPLCARPHGSEESVGTPKAKLMSLYPKVEFHSLPEHWWTQGRDTGQAEEPHDIRERAARFKDWLLSLNKTGGARKVAVVSHMPFLRELLGIRMTACQAEIRHFVGSLAASHWPENADHIDLEGDPTVRVHHNPNDSLVGRSLTSRKRRIRNPMVLLAMRTMPMGGAPRMKLPAAPPATRPMPEGHSSPALHEGVSSLP